MSKSFIQFLSESKIDQELNQVSEVEKFFKFDDDGNVDGLEEGKYEWEQYEFVNEESDEDFNGATFGDESIIDLDWGSTGVKEGDGESETLKYLKGRKNKSIADLQRDFVQYIVEPPDAPETGYKLMRRSYKDPDGERHEVSPEEIEAILIQKNRLAKAPDSYSFNDNGELLKNGKTLTRNRKTTFLKKLNTKVEEWQKKHNDARLIHYKWETKDGVQKNDTKPGEEYTNRLMINTTDWDDSDKTNLKRYETAEYSVMTNKEDQDFLINILNKKDNSAEKNSKKKEWTYDHDRHVFLYGGNVVYGKELLKMVSGLNGGITVDKKQKGHTEESSYWKHFKISVSGSKVGDVANFSLPPVITCNKDAPCINDGCYAVKAYPIYPISRTAQEINLGLLQDGEYERFEQEIGRIFDPNNKKKMKYFRFFVSGDCFSKELMNSIINIANKHRGVNFWMYTKQYALLINYIGKIPDNLTILVSCWGDFCPSLYDPKAPGKRVKDGETAPFAELEKHFPLAYLDDGTDNTKNYMNVEKEQIVCPCTDDDEVVAHCDACKKCFEVGNLKGNIVFKKH